MHKSVFLCISDIVYEVQLFWMESKGQSQLQICQQISTSILSKVNMLPVTYQNHYSDIFS